MCSVCVGGHRAPSPPDLGSATFLSPWWSVGLTGPGKEPPPPLLPPPPPPSSSSAPVPITHRPAEVVVVVEVLPGTEGGKEGKGRGVVVEGRGLAAAN